MAVLQEEGSQAQLYDEAHESLDPVFNLQSFQVSSGFGSKGGTKPNHVLPPVVTSKAQLLSNSAGFVRTSFEHQERFGCSWKF